MTAAARCRVTNTPLRAGPTLLERLDDVRVAAIGILLLIIVSIVAIVRIRRARRRPSSPATRRTTT